MTADLGDGDGRIRRHTLPNGLTVLGEHLPHSRSTAAGLFVDAGARDEGEDVAGVSHFLEHMAFKGDGEADWQAVNRAFDDMGAACNAYTSHEVTCYHGQVLPERSGELLHWLGRLMRPALREADFETERQVILEEIAMCNDDPGHRAYEAAMAGHFPGHGLGRSILGPAETIRALSVDQMRDYHAARYTAGATVLAVAGQFDWDEVVRQAEREWSAWPAGGSAARPGPARVGGGRIVLRDEKLTRAYTLMVSPGPAADDEGRWAAAVLSGVLGDDEGSRLYWALVDPALAEEADFGWGGNDGVGAYYLSLASDPDAAEDVLDIARRELARVAEDLTAEEVARAKTKAATLLAMNAESPGGRMRALGGDWLSLGEVRPIERLADRLAAVTPEEVAARAADLADERTTTVMLGR